VGQAVRDKDGISAAVLAAELAAVRWAEGQTLLDELMALARRYGLFVSGQRSLTMPGKDGVERIAAMMARLRASPPPRVGGLAVLAVSDYQARQRAAADGTRTPLSLPASNVLGFELEGNSRVVARPSGTEPKIKFYVDLCEPIVEGEPFEEAERRAREKMEGLASAFLAAAGPG
jgi:phosphomannomutase